MRNQGCSGVHLGNPSSRFPLWLGLFSSDKKSEVDKYQLSMRISSSVLCLPGLTLGMADYFGQLP